MKELVRAEVARARDNAEADVRRLKKPTILLGVAAALFVVALAMFDLAVVFALGSTVEAALLIAFIVVLEVLVIGFIGYRKLPKVLFERSRS